MTRRFLSIGLFQLTMKINQLVIVLGDQLNHDSAAFDDFDPDSDRVWMAENDVEATHVWCHKTRLVAFFSPMRHFRDELKAAGWDVLYHELTADRAVARGAGFDTLLAETLRQHEVGRIVVAKPGDHRVEQQIRTTSEDAGIALEVCPDRHFFCSPERFQDWASGRRSMVMEQFYRTMRTEHDVLLDPNGDPVGGQWNFDKENRGKFGRRGPQAVPSVPRFEPDAITRDVIEMVENRFPEHPGTTEHFDLPVSRADALVYLHDFVKHRLAQFGKFQDAMWGGEDFLYHSRLSQAINLHLLSPREVVAAAVEAYELGNVPINSAEGFVRQIIGWREYVRGIYWSEMPEYETRNSLQCDETSDVPSFFWDGKTDMVCVADAMRLLIQTAYAHHIQRLMVLGLFAQLFGTHPSQFHRWHMAMYADAVDWVSLPNALGMSQYGDGGLMATKPYCASGRYIDRMSNHCKSCRYDPTAATGERACPFTTLYWDFLQRNHAQFAGNHRMAFQLKNLERKSAAELQEISSRAQQIRGGHPI